MTCGAATHTHTRTQADTLKANLLSLEWSWPWQVTQERRHRQSGERDLTALRSHPGSQTRGRHRRGSLTLNNGDGGWRLARSVSRGNFRHQSVRTPRDSEGGESEADKSRENSKTPAVSSSSSSGRNLTHEEPQRHRTSSRPALHRRSPFSPLFVCSSLSVFWYHLTLDFAAPAMSSQGAQVSAPLLECKGSRTERQRCWGGQRLLG